MNSYGTALGVGFAAGAPTERSPNYIVEKPVRDLDKVSEIHITFAGKRF